MSDYYSANRTLVNAGTLPLAQGSEGGECKKLVDSYTVVGSPAIGSTIEFTKLPQGSIITGIKFVWTDMSDSGVASALCGDSVDPDRYYKTTELDLHAVGGGIDAIDIGGIGHKVGVPSAVTGIPAEDRAIILTTEGGVLLEGGKIVMIVDYI